MYDVIRCAVVKDYVEVIVEAKPTYTWFGMLSEHEVLERWALSKPGCTILGLGLSDTKRKTNNYNIETLEVKFIRKN